MRARLLPLIADYPGAAKALCLKGSGAICGCMKCNVRGTDCSAESKKKVHDCYRRWLPADHDWRHDPRFGDPEERSAPPLRTHADELRALCRLMRRSIPAYDELCNRCDVFA